MFKASRVSKTTTGYCLQPHSGRPVVELSEIDYEKYQRQMKIAGFGEEGQRKLKNSSALVTRAGGVGGPACLYLAAAGIGRLVVMHGGNLTWPDLNRQILMTHDWVGKLRADKIRESILRLNPEVELTVIAENPSDDNADHWVAGVNVVCDCAPTFEERYALNRTVVRHRKPMIEGAMNGMEAYLTVIVPGETPCLQCIYPQIPDWWSWAEFAALGAVPGMVGCMAAVEAIKVITGFGKPLMNSLLAFDAESHEYKKFKLHRSPNCPVCAHL